MDPVIWPADLPSCMVRQGYQESVRDGRLRTGMDAGPPKVRLRSTAVTRQVSASLILTYDEMARFDRFWEEDLCFGVSPFLVRDQTRDGHALATASGEPVLGADGTPLLIAAWWIAIFGEGAPQFARASSKRFEASFSLEIYR